MKPSTRLFWVFWVIIVFLAICGWWNFIRIEPVDGRLDELADRLSNSELGARTNQEFLASLTGQMASHREAFWKISTDSTNRLSSTRDELQRRIDPLAAKLVELEQTQTGLSQPFAEARGLTNDFRARIDEVTMAQKSMQAQLDGLEKTLDAFGRVFDDFKRQLDDFRQNLTNRPPPPGPRR